LADYNVCMNLDMLKNKTILLLGKTRALDKNEFVSQLKQHNITCVDAYVDEVVCVVEGRMLNPVEQEEMERLYKENAAYFMMLSDLERDLCEQIDPDKLHMSLKLSGDEERLLSFLQNNFITDELFLRLISLYDWKGENFFENDDNRDTTAALIKRFYKDIEKNHNVQYATTGLLHLIIQTDNKELLETISNLEPIKKALREEQIENGTFKILQAIALHPQTSAPVIKMFIKYAPLQIKAQIATRNDLGEKFQTHLHQEKSILINEYLAKNSTLDHRLAKEMIGGSEFTEDISLFIELDEDIFELLLEKYADLLAQNPSLSPKMIEKLFGLGERKILLALATNEALKEDDYERLYTMQDKEINHALALNAKVSVVMLQKLYEKGLSHVALAGNTSTPKEILSKLSSQEDEEVLTALSKNTSTPVEVLCQLQLDKRYDRYVKENNSFGKYIQSDNIGWL